MKPAPERLLVRELDSVLKARLSYADPAFPDRRCSRCGNVYRGPAAYCSPDCEMAVMDN